MLHNSLNQVYRFYYYDNIWGIFILDECMVQILGDGNNVFDVKFLPETKRNKTFEVFLHLCKLISM